MWEILHSHLLRPFVPKEQSYFFQWNQEYGPIFDGQRHFVDCQINDDQGYYQASQRKLCVMKLYFDKIISVSDSRIVQR